MLYCDRRCEGCNIWYHYDCLGLSLSEGRRLGASQENFVVLVILSLLTSTQLPMDQFPNLLLRTRFNLSHVWTSCGTVVFQVNRFVIF